MAQTLELGHLNVHLLSIKQHKTLSGGLSVGVRQQESVTRSLGRPSRDKGRDQMQGTTALLPLFKQPFNFL